MKSIQLFATGVLLGLTFNVIADDDVVVVVSSENPAQTLSAEQIANIFLGKTAFFPDGKRAVPIDLTEGSPVRTAFYQTFAGKSPAQMKMHWAKLIFTGRGQPPRTAKDFSEVKQLLKENPDTIGYIARDQVDNSVAVVNVDSAER